MPAKRIQAKRKKSSHPKRKLNDVKKSIGKYRDTVEKYNYYKMKTNKGFGDAY